MNRYTDKVAVITGGARRIGRACADWFLREGAYVAVNDINPLHASWQAQILISVSGGVGFLSA